MCEKAAMGPFTLAGNFSSKFDLLQTSPDSKPRQIKIKNNAPTFSGTKRDWVRKEETSYEQSFSSTNYNVHLKKYLL